MRKICWVMGTLWLVSLPSRSLHPACYQEPPQTWVGGMGIRETVEQINAREQSKKATGVPVLRQASRRLRAYRKHKGDLHLSPAPRASQLPPKPPPIAHPFSPQTASTSFLGAQTSDGGLGITPLDAMGAVGLTQILVCTNGTIKVFDRSGTLGALNVTTDSFFGSVLSNGSTTDVRVRYDITSGRWFVMCLDGDGGTVPNSFLIAVSDAAASTITSTSSFTFFKFTAGLGAGGAAATSADSDGIGIDAVALYVGVNLFDATPNYVGSAAFVVQKSSILGAGPPVVTSFPGIADATFTGAFTPTGVDNDDPAPAFGYFVGVDASTTWGNPTGSSLTNKLYLIRIKNPGTAPTIDGTFTLTVPPYGFSYGNDITFGLTPAVGVAIKGSKVVSGITAGVDDLDQRLTVAQIRSGNLWTVHNIDVDAGGNATLAGDRDGARWYELTNLAASPPTVAQSGTLFDPSASNPQHYLVPSLAVSRQGHMALGSTRGGVNEFAEIAAAGRLAGDPADTIQAATLLQASSTNYNFDVDVGLDPAPVSPQRWGDYSYTCVDPTDGMTLWTFQEYCNATDSMGVRVVRLLAPPPAAPTATPGNPFPASVNSGISSILVSITGTSTAGSGYFEPGPGFPNHFGAAVSGNVGVNRIVVVDPTHLTLDLNTTSATLGPVNVTLTNPDGQSVLATGLLTITASSATAATITQVTSTSANGTYGTGAVIPITVAFSEAVTVAGGTPTLQLSSGGTASYTSGSGSANLIFSYTVAAGEGTAGLNLDAFNSGTSLMPNGATMLSSGVPANLTLPVGATTSPPWSLPSQTSIIIDTTPPITSITGSPPNPSNQPQPTFSYTSNQANCTFEIMLDAGAWVPKGAGISTQVGPLPDGSHTFHVRATDPLGNVDPTPPSYTWVIDTVPPVTTINTKPPNPDTNASPTFTYSANKAGCVFQTQIDGGAWSAPPSASGSKTLGPLASGSHTFSVRATDLAGNTDPAPPTYTWMLNVPPASGGGGGGGGGCGLTGLEGLLIVLSLRVRRAAAGRA